MGSCHHCSFRRPRRNSQSGSDRSKWKWSNYLKTGFNAYRLSRLSHKSRSSGCHT